MRLGLLGLCLLATAVHGGEPPCADSVYRAWDFWIGHWRVTSLDGVVQGTNTITRQESGCLLVESWRGARGATGQSYNFYDRALGAWRQIWVSGSAIIDYSGGPTADGAMRLEGRITYQSSGQTARFSGRWTPRVDGTVLQELRQWSDETGSWDEWFTGVYTPLDAGH